MPESSSPAGPKDVFLHLLGIVALYVSVVSFLTLIFQEVNALFPDPLTYSFGADTGSVRSAMAALLILFPVYLFVSRLLFADLRSEPGKARLAIRRWLSHFTLFIAAITIIIDLVTLVTFFLNGDLTARFLLKVLAVLFTAGAVFWYYIWDLRHPAPGVKPVRRNIALAASVAAALAFLGGFSVIGSPFQQRQARFDERRVADLQQLQGEIINYWVNENRLPAGLGDLQNLVTGFYPPVDPATGEAYAYRPVSPLSFELCADFATEQKTASPQPRGAYPAPAASPQWTHAKGHVCFTRTIDPALYRPKAAPAKS